MEQVAIKPWGNSQGIRLSKSILEKAGIETDDHLSVEIQEHSIILRKVFRHQSFEERLAQYDGKMEVYDFDWGDPVGKELV